MEFRYLKSFLVLAEELHFGRAALRLNMTQPTLTNQIRALEGEIGDRLFARTSRRVELTRVGAEFLNHAAGVVSSHDRALAAARRQSARSEGALKVGYTTASFIRFVSAAAQRFRCARANVHLELVELRTDEQVTALRDGDLDIGFLHPPLSSTALRLKSLPAEPMILAVPSRDTGDLGDDIGSFLARFPLIIFPREKGPALFDAIMSFCRTLALTPEVELDVLPWTSAINLVSCGAGVAFVPRSLRCHRPKGVRFVNLDRESLALPHAYGVSETAGNELIPRFIDEVRPRVSAPR